MKRLAFNGGEVSPELALRSDMDVYHRSCRVVENFDVSVMGGVTRRKGMRYFAQGQRGAKLFAYEYNEQERFLVEVGHEAIRVYNADGVQEFEGECDYEAPLDVCGEVVNAVMIFACAEAPVMELRHEGDGKWSWKEFQFKKEAWRYSELRDRGVTVTRDEEGIWGVEFEGKEEEIEKRCCAGDKIRVSFWTEQAEASARAADALYGVRAVTMIDESTEFKRGEKIAIRGEKQVRYYSCVEAWTGSSAFVSGLSSPANYTANFLASEAQGEGEKLTPITALTKAMSFAKGSMVAFETGYWEYWTCVRDFSGLKDAKQGMTSPGDYPGYFMRGIAMGGALPCKGVWKFVCSGAWIGEYEVRRNYDSAELDVGEWESRGTSLSPLGGTLNTAITGDEKEEVCWLRLFLTKSYYMGDNFKDGFPSDACDNKLVVSSYKHDMELAYSEVEDEEGEVVSSSWERTDKVAPEFESGSLTSKDWSWQAYSEKYGYPSVVELHEMRLVLAGTRAQPLTIWMSKNDDLDNFELGETDDSGLALTMAGKTQDPICWMMSRSSKIQLGTTNAEYVICSTTGAALTYANARSENHGYHGSARIQAIQASDRVLYCQRGGGRLFEYGYSEEIGGFVSKDLTVYAPHVLREHGGVIDGCYARVPDPRAIFALGDGQVALMTYNSMHEVHAWQRYVTDGRVTSCAALVNPSGADSLFFLVERGDESFIEVIDEASGYVDNGGRDYVSTVVTNAITVQEADARRGAKPAVYFYLGEDAEVEGMEVSVDGEEWRRLDRNEKTISRGWHQMVADGGISWEKELGLRVRGARGLQVLAMQS